MAAPTGLTLGLRPCARLPIVEIPAVIDRAGAHPLPLAPLAPEQRALLQAGKPYEVLTSEGQEVDRGATKQIRAEVRAEKAEEMRKMRGRRRRGV